MASFFDSQFSSSSHRDLRAEERAVNRERKQKQKYYAYRGVKPSWVGQHYYDLIVVREENVDFKRNRKTKKFCSSVVVEHELPIRLDDVLSRQLPFYQSYAAAYITHAINENTEKHKYLTPLNTNTETLVESADLTALFRQCAVSGADLKGLRVKLKVRIWTKRDNFCQKEFFVGGPDVRHHRGKRRVRERHCKKRTEHDQQRDNRSHAIQRRAVEEANFTVPDKWGCVWGDPEAQDSMSNTIFWDYGNAGHNIWEYGEEEPGTDDLIRARLAGETDQSPAYHMRWTALQRQAAAPTITEGGESSFDDELWDDFALSLNSSEIIFVQRDETEGLVDVDALSDLADAFDDWDLVSDSSSPV